ncbi:helix-turn-helix domain-containing protein [Thermus sp. SYSU G05001]|uniref:Helix-turn-helix domain-containing protein n=1 Tax=Thermus brevis TaxID=2862456 RepID=A0ABS7A1D0_9DEIN|nr:helix-turn-helix domain-containing protein [Thermus brevis]MBW6396162.1 helix-turn-helix domain-containing protein [Thermus brevis]
MNDLPPVMNVPETAELLRVSQSTVWRLIRGGRLRATRIGRRVLITRQAVETLLENGTSGVIPWYWELEKARGGARA